MKSIAHYFDKAFFGRYRFPYRKYQDRTKCIFIHIPKAAGTSVLQALGKEGVEGRDHLPWLVYKKANAKKFETYFKFAFVRDPLDRAYSAYEYLVKGGNQTHDLVTADKLKTFSGFEDFVINGLGKGLYRNHVMFLPQSFFIINNDNELAVDFVGKFECIEQDFARVKKTLGLTVDLTHENKGKQSKDLSAIRNNEQVMSVMFTLYAQDYLLLDYSVE
ncbi:sulfotransferase family 2 domain-containing protein [Marinomonas sp. NPDC078689]|uniref:sulfotransferase family 2 domain-containing protein n=1 Tax=Marinomonas sp. NPDC078689 TaxID=3364147 RepID=UPI0037C637D5